MIHEKYQSRLLAMCCCISFVTCFGTSIKIVVVTNNDDPPPFYPSCGYGINHHINQHKHVHNQKVSLFFNLVSIIYLMGTIIAA